MFLKIVKAIIACCLILLIPLTRGITCASDVKSGSSQMDAKLQHAVDGLKKAIQLRDFAPLKLEMPDHKPLSRGLCNSDVRKSLSFDALINELVKFSKKTRIIVNSKPVQLLDLTTIETSGWTNGYSYLYFEFKKTNDSWQWLGVYDCDKRSSDFRFEQEGKRLGDQSQAAKIEKDDDRQVTQLINEVNKIISNRDFRRLNVFVSRVTKYSWGPCGPGDSGAEEISFERLSGILTQASKGLSIDFSQKPKVSSSTASVETEGWVGEYPFLTFNFNLLKAKNQWVLSGACYSALPELMKHEGEYVPIYFKEPHLPRPGARIFKDQAALRARIAEIAQLKKFDALKSYATKKVLTFGQCNLSMMENDRIEGKEVPVQDVINYLKGVQSNGEIVSSGTQHKTYYETTGWHGEYPFIAFWFSEDREGWALAGVSYCKMRHFELFPPLPSLK